MSKLLGKYGHFHGNNIFFIKYECNCIIIKTNTFWCIILTKTRVKEYKNRGLLYYDP